MPQAIGEYMNQKGVKTAYLIAPNYAAGKDVIAGLKANFKGQIFGEDYTRWPDQLDFSAELSKARAAKPDAVFAFYPGAAGVQFLTQYAQAGLRGQIPLYTSFIIDALSLPQLKDLALGVPGAQHWVVDLPNDANKKFVADFKKKYNREPSFYASQAYDAAMLIDSAVKAAGGDLTKKDAMRDAMRKAELRLGARALQIRQQPLPDPEFLSAGGGEGRRRFHHEDRRRRAEGSPGPLCGEMPDEVVTPR